MSPNPKMIRGKPVIMRGYSTRIRLGKVQSGVKERL